ncbi:MAG: PAS domain S-box protein [Polyangia bacterium]
MPERPPESLPESPPAGLPERLDDALVRGLVESAPDALVLTDGCGRIVFVNAQAERLFGYPRSELLGQPIEILVPDGVRGTHEALRTRYTAAPRRRDMGAGFSLRCRRRDGSELPVEISLSPVPTPQGTFTAAAVRDISERQRADQALRDAEELFRLTFENAPIGMALIGLDGCFLRVNQALCSMFGYTAEELSQRSFLKITHPEDRALHLSSMESLARGEVRSFQLSKRYLRKDGRALDTLLSVSSVRDAAGHPLYNIGQIEDVTERKQAEEARRRNEDHLNRAQRVAHIGSWDWDLRTGEIHRSAELYEIYGTAPDSEHRQALSYLGVIHAEDRERVRHAVGEAARCGSPFNVEYRLLRADGSERIIVSAGEPVLNEGRPVRMVGTVLDVTERKRLEQGREDALRWLRTVLDQCPVAIALLHADSGARLELNRYAQTLLGGPPETSRSLSEMVLLQESGEPLPEHERPCVRALSGESLSRLPFTLQTATGASVPVLLDAAPIRDEAGAVRGAVIALQDITLLKQLDRLRAEWNSVVAHDLRQPVSSILLIAQSVARRQREPSEYARLAGQIAQSAERLSGMINDLLDSSRLEAGQLSLTLRRTDLASLLRDSIERSELEVPDRRFELCIAGALPLLRVDGERITQVMDNLLSNAMKYGEPETPITVSAEARAQQVEVRVTNTGSGITAEDLPHLFQRFHRTASARHSSIRGIGLGLYIVKQLVAAHGGQITVDSTPGGATTFAFTLPAA